MHLAQRWQGPVLAARLSAGAAAVGGAVYLLQSWLYAHTQASILDEGAYLVGGFLFASGRYRPFQDYGPWTNQMPLSFLIPGYIQLLFGPGLRAGRYFALLLGALMLLGLWLAARRLAGPGWAAGAVLAVALNPAEVKMYSVAASQVLAAAMLTWTLALVLGEGRALWQLLAGSALAAGMALTRLNLIPVLPLVLWYVFWQHGRRAGLWASAAGLAILLAGHTLFWPGILRLWAAWLPAEATPFLAPWRPPPGEPLWSPDPGLESRLLSFLLGLRYHFVAAGGALAALMLWPRREEWRSVGARRASLFLAGLFFVLLFAHAWASLGANEQTYDALGRNYCVFCFPVYLAFFAPAGVLLLVASVASWRWRLPAWRQAAIAAFILALATGLGFSAFDPLGDRWLDWRVPRLRTLLAAGRWLPGKVPLWEFLQNKVGLGYFHARRLLPGAAGFGLGAFVLAISAGIRRLAARKGRAAGPSFGALALAVFLLLGWLLSPSAALGAGYQTYDCGGDVIASYETAGRYLAARLPAGARLYWQGGLSPAPLLYLPQAQLYPPQLNATYTFRLSGEREALLKYGFWDRQLAEAWLGEADFALVQERYFQGWLQSALLEPGRFERLGQTPPTEPCRGEARILVFRNLQPSGR